ncbi:MAG: GAF domain-containing protein [Betaproteobacteria bacterium]
MISTDNLVAEFNKLITELRTKANASRTTLRLDDEQRGFNVNGVVAESLAPGINSIAAEIKLQQRKSRTASYLEQHRQILVQNDCANANPQPPKELMQIYGTKAQMMAPVVRGSKMVGWLSVHYNLSTREWTSEDINALEAALAATHRIMDQM